MSITEQHQYLSVTDSGRSSFDHEMASSSFLINNPLEDEPASAAESAVSTPVQMQLLSKLLNQSNKSGSNSNEAAEDSHGSAPGEPRSPIISKSPPPFPGKVAPKSRVRQADKDEAFCAPSRQIFVANINFEGLGRELERFFAAFGPIESMKLYPPSRFAFIIFADLESAVRAKEACTANVPLFRGRKLIVNYGKQAPEPTQQQHHHQHHQAAVAASTASSSYSHSAAQNHSSVMPATSHSGHSASGTTPSQHHHHVAASAAAHPHLHQQPQAYSHQQHHSLQQHHSFQQHHQASATSAPRVGQLKRQQNPHHQPSQQEQQEVLLAVRQQLLQQQQQLQQQQSSYHQSLSHHEGHRHSNQQPHPIHRFAAFDQTSSYQHQPHQTKQTSSPSLSIAPASVAAASLPLIQSSASLLSDPQHQQQQQQQPAAVTTGMVGLNNGASVDSPHLVPLVLAQMAASQPQVKTALMNMLLQNVAAQAQVQAQASQHSKFQSHASQVHATQMASPLHLSQVPPSLMAAWQLQSQARTQVNQPLQQQRVQQSLSVSQVSSSSPLANVHDPTELPSDSLLSLLLSANSSSSSGSNPQQNHIQLPFQQQQQQQLELETSTLQQLQGLLSSSSSHASPSSLTSALSSPAPIVSSYGGLPSIPSTHLSPFQSLQSQSNTPSLLAAALAAASSHSSSQAPLLHHQFPSSQQASLPASTVTSLSENRPHHMMMGQSASAPVQADHRMAFSGSSESPSSSSSASVPLSSCSNLSDYQMDDIASRLFSYLNLQ